VLPHRFKQQPVHTMLKDDPTLCGHMAGDEVCGKRPDHPMHGVHVDVEAALLRRMTGAAVNG
jgi:hypothetical protein